MTTTLDRTGVVSPTKLVIDRRRHASPTDFGKNNTSIAPGESQHSERDEHFRTAPTQSRRKGGNPAERLSCSPTLGNARMGLFMDWREEEDEEGGSESDSSTVEGSPQLARRGNRTLIVMCGTSQNNDEDLRSSGELRNASREVEDDGALSVHRMDVTSHLDEENLRKSPIITEAIVDIHENRDEGDDDEGYVYLTAKEEDGENGAAVYDDEDVEEDDEDGCLGYPDVYSVSFGAQSILSCDEDDDSQDSDFSPASEDGYEYDSLEYTSYTYDDDIVDEEDPLPFWFGQEDSKHIECIVRLYKEQLVSAPAKNLRSLRPFVGSISRIAVANGRNFETFDTVQICNNQRMGAGRAMPVEKTVHVITTWEVEDGLPESFQLLPATCLDHWAQIVAGKDCFFLYCEPQFFELDSFAYSRSMTPREVGYATLPWQHTPFDAVAPRYADEQQSLDDIFPGAQSDIDGPFAPTDDPSWEWL